MTLAAGYDVVKVLGYFDSDFSRHAGSSKRRVKFCQDLLTDPYCFTRKRDSE
jgi:hypothetical protein